MKVIYENCNPSGIVFALAFKKFLDIFLIKDAINLHGCHDLYGLMIWKPVSFRLRWQFLMKVTKCHNLLEWMYETGKSNPKASHDITFC